MPEDDVRNLDPWDFMDSGRDKKVHKCTKCGKPCEREFIYVVAHKKNEDGNWVPTKKMLWFHISCYVKGDEYRELKPEGETPEKQIPEDYNDW